MSIESLEFLLDLDAKVDGLMGGLEGIEKTIKQLHALDRAGDKVVETTKRVERASHGAKEAHDKHGHALWQLGHHYGEAKGAAMEFAEAAGFVLAFEAIEKIVEKVKELGQEIILAGAKAERTEKSFKLLLGAEGGEHLLEYLENIHKHTEFSLETLQGLAGALLRVGFAGRGLQYAVAAAIDLAAMPGGNLQEAATALERIKRTGRIDNRTLGGIGVGEKDFLAEIAARTGKSAGVLKKEIDKGTIDADQSLSVLYELIRKRTHRSLGTAGDEMSTTMSASLTHLKEVPEELFKQISKSPAFDRLNLMVRDLTDRLDPKTEAGKDFFKSMDQSLTHFVDELAKIDLGKLITDVSRLLEKGPALVDFLFSLAKATLAVGQATVWVYEHTVPGQLLLKHLAGSQPPADVEKGRQAGKNMLGAGAVPPTGKAFIEGQLWGESVGDGVKKGMADTLEIHSPSRVFERMGRMSGQGYLDGVDDTIGDMTDVVPKGAVARPAGGGAPAAPIQVTVNVTTNVNGGHATEAGAAEIGQQVATAVEHILPGALKSAFERMGQEAGVT